MPDCTERRSERGSVMVVVMTLLVALAIIAAGIIAFSGRGLAGANRSVQALTAETCVQSAVEYGRQFYGDNYPGWDDMLSGAQPGFNNPGAPQSEWGAGSYGRMDGQPIGPSTPPQFRVTLSDNVDEIPPAAPNPGRDNDLLVVIRAECIDPGLQASALDFPVGQPAPDPNGWRGVVPQDTDMVRRNRVVEIELSHIATNVYTGQRGGGSDGSRNLSN